MQQNTQIKRNFMRPVALCITVGILVFFAVFPLFWILLTSFKSNADILAVEPVFWFSPTLEHWKKVLFEGDFLQYYVNSFLIAGATVIVVMTIATLAAFGLARFNMRGREDIAFFILSQRMMPPVAVVLPYFILASTTGALDTYWVLIAINVGFNLPLSVWMIRGFIEGTSHEIEEAAIVDGASPFGAFLRVTVPQIWPGLLSTSLFVYVYTVNEFLFASILSGTGTRPVSVAVQLFLPTGVRGTLFGEAAVASILIILPGLIFASVMQRYLVSGVSMGAVKG